MHLELQNANPCTFCQDKMLTINCQDAGYDFYENMNFMMKQLGLRRVFEIIDNSMEQNIDLINRSIAAQVNELVKST